MQSCLLPRKYILKRIQVFESQSTEVSLQRCKTDNFLAMDLKMLVSAKHGYKILVGLRPTNTFS